MTLTEIAIELRYAAHDQADPRRTSVLLGIADLVEAFEPKTVHHDTAGDDEAG